MLLLFIYLINLYIRPQDWVPFFYHWPVDYIVIIPTLMIGYFSHLKEKGVKIVIPQHKLLIGFLVCVFLSNAVHFDLSGGWLEFILFAKKICIFYIFFLILKAQKNLSMAMRFIVLLSVILGIQAVYQIRHEGIGWAGQGLYAGFDMARVRWVGLWDGANIFALLLNLAVTFALEFSLGRYMLISRIINFIFLGILGYGIFLTNSKGGFITFLGIIFFYFSLRMKKKMGMIIALVLVAIIFLAFAPSRLTIGAVLGDTARAHLWEQGIEWFKENPFLGIGKGHFRDDSYHHLVAHSNFIQNLAEVGFIGVFLFMGLIYFSFKGLYIILKELKLQNKMNSLLYSLSRALMISFIGFNICTLFITMEIDIFYAWLGLCAAAFAIFNRQYKQVELKVTGQDVRNIFLIIIGLLFIYWLKS